MKGTSKAQPVAELPFTGKVALVTGAASGIGRATALAFGRAGACVVVADTAIDGGHATAAMIVESGGKALFVRSDISKSGEVAALIEKTINYYGRLDFAVNNAALDEEGAPLAEGEEEQFDRIMGANVKGVWLCMKLQLRQMLKQGGGAIVNVSSVSGLVGAPNRAIYAASKHAVVGLTRSAAAEYAREGIRINALCPGAVKNPRTADAQLEAPQPMGRFAEAAEIANAALWLCSEQASYVNGHELVVDGGFTAV
jgi:NAD(P)-dependent dehydrogenase (short-subunit alcohol dehydrogenase family)